MPCTSILKTTISPITGIPNSGIKRSSPSPSSLKFRSQRISAVCSSTTASSTAEKTRSSYLNSNGTVSSSPCSSLYEVLGISMGASNHEIKSAYRRLAREFHPDVATVDRKDSSADAFIQIHAAYSTLSDPGKRSVYDRDLLRLNRQFDSFPGISSGFGGYTRRNWETDQCW